MFGVNFSNGFDISSCISSYNVLFYILVVMLINKVIIVNDGLSLSISCCQIRSEFCMASCLLEQTSVASNVASVK